MEQYLRLLRIEVVFAIFYSAYQAYNLSGISKNPLGFGAVERTKLLSDAEDTIAGVAEEEALPSSLKPLSFLLNCPLQKIPDTTPTHPQSVFPFPLYSILGESLHHHSKSPLHYYNALLVQV